MNNIPESGVLDSIYEIEDILEAIARSDKKIEHFEKLKKHRTNVLDEKIEQLENENIRLRQVIFDTMKALAPDDKTVDFPGVGKVTRKKPKEKWVVENEDEVIKYLEKEKLDKDAVKTVKKIVKKELDKVLDNAAKRGIAVPGANIDAGAETLSVSFDKNYKPGSEAETGEVDKVSKTVEVEELDELEV